MQFPELDSFLKSHPSLAKQTIVFEQTENSDLIEMAKPCNEEFFEKVFSPTGPFWSAYKELELGEQPIGSQHLVFLNGRMFFCRNIEKKILYSVGLRKDFVFKNNELKERAKISLDNFLLGLASPFDFAKQVSSLSLAALRINEALAQFEEFSAEAKKFYEKNSQGAVENPRKLAQEALLGALAAMRFSFFSSIAFALKIKLKHSRAIDYCELEELSNAIKNSDSKNISENFGFYSNNPYDISTTRFSENPKNAFEFATMISPKDLAARWRENCKFLCARYLAIERRCFQAVGKKTGLGKKAFFLHSTELLGNPKELLETALQREKEFLGFSKETFPKTIVFDGKWNFYEKTGKGEISGISAGAKKTVSGKTVFVNLELDYKKDVSGKIIVSKTLAPNLCLLLGSAIGIVSASGGAFAHTAIVCREQDIPCIVQAQNISLLKEGEEIEINGTTGKITSRN